MIPSEKLNELIDQLQSDIRFEVILAELLADGLSMEDVIVDNNSLFARNYHRDIEKTEQIEQEHQRKKKFRIVVNREGIYDRVPQDIFHQPSDPQKKSDKEKVLKEIQFQNELEKSARQFFKPLEQEFYRLRMKLEMEERKFLFETNDDLNTELMDALWNLPDFFNDFQKSRLGLLMPLLNKIVGNTTLVAFVMSIISGDRVEIFQSAPQRQKVNDSLELGKNNLGKNTVLDGELVANLPSFTIKIFVENETHLTDYLPGGKKNKIHNFFCNLFLPLENDVMLELDFSNTALPFVIENETDWMGRLNYSTVI